MEPTRLKTARACFLLEDFHPIVHGASVQTIMLSERLIAGGSTVMVVTRRLEAAHAASERFKGIDVHRVPPVVGVNRFGKYLMLLPALWLLFRKRHEFDFLIVADLKVLGIVGVIAAKLLGKICVLNAVSCGEMDGSYATVYQDTPSASKLFMIRSLIWLRNRLLLRADDFLGISSTLTDEFRRSGVPEEKISLIHYGLDSRKFAALGASEKRAMVEKLGLPEGRLITFTGRLITGKGVEYLVPAFHRLVEEFDDARLVLVGSGQGYGLSCEDELRKYVSEHGLDDRVAFVGSVHNVSEYLQASDYFAFPSQSEGLGLSLIEAMACELPSVATGVGGILDIIDDGENGLLVEYADVPGIAQALRSLLVDADYSNRLAKAARETVLRKFDIESKADEYLELFTRLQR